MQVPGVHDPLDPEYSILKQRLARRVRYEQLDPTKMNLVDITHLAERTITNVSVCLVHAVAALGSSPSFACMILVSGKVISSACAQGSK
jgi:hypothetical protein